MAIGSCVFVVSIDTGTALVSKNNRSVLANTFWRHSAIVSSFKISLTFKVNPFSSNSALNPTALKDLIPFSDQVLSS